jgi:tRNA dimethylallyltransferase
MKNGDRNRPVVFIAGPTASGKSATAAELARVGNGVVVNADALQVYRELNILSARPSPEEERAIPHRLYGFVPAATAYSVGLWLAEARTAIEECWASGRMPIVTGGTGLYFKALEQGLVQLPPIPAAIRRHWRERLKREGAASLHAELTAADAAEASRLRVSDPQRIVRALEVISATGKSLSAWQQEARGAPFLERSRLLKLYISPPREQLYRQIDERFDRMIAQGAVAEVQSLLAMRLDPSLPAMKAIGIEELGRALLGEIPLEEACRIAKRNTRHYAKRQLTWARSNMIAWNWLTEQFLVNSMGHFVNFISDRG